MKTSSLTRVCRYEGRTYEQAGQMGDWNHLLTVDRDLAGFDFSYAVLFFPEILTSRLVRETANVTCGEAGLQVNLKKDSELQSDCCQAIGSWVFADRRGDHVIVVPEVTEWGVLWRNTSFNFSDGGDVEFEMG